MSRFLPAEPSNLPRAEQRRRDILAAVLRVVADGGVDAVTHRRVAAEAGVPLGSTTYYFDSREALLREAFQHDLARVDAAFSQLADEFSGGDVEALVEMFVELSRRQLADAAPLRAEYELILFAARDPEVARALHAWEDRMVGSLAQRLERLGAARPVDAGRTLLQLARGAELDQLTRDEIDPDDLRRRVRVVVAALTGRPADERAA